MLLIDPCVKIFFRMLPSPWSFSKFYVMGVVLEVTAFGAWEHSKSKDVKCFFLVA